MSPWLREGWGDVNAVDGNGNLPLCLAAFRGESTLVTMLLKAGANPSLRDGHGYSPLRLVAQSFTHTAVEALLKAGAPVDAADADGVTPLVAACLAVNPAPAAIVRLLAAGADPLQRAPSGEPLIALGARKPRHRTAPEERMFRDDVVKVLVDGGVDIDAPGVDGRTELQVVADELLKHRVHFWQGERFLGAEAVLLTLWHGELSYEQGGKKKLAKVAQEYRWARADCPEHLPFCLASQAAAGLLKRGADPNRGEADRRPLFALFEVGVPALVKAAMRAGADPTRVRSDGVGCVLLGVRSHHWEPVKQALQAGADPNACGADGVTALHLAAVEGDVGLVRRLIRGGADTAARAAADAEGVLAGECPLEVVQRLSHADLVPLLS